MLIIKPQKKGGYQLSAEMWLPAPLGEVFNFFAEASNLELLTPSMLRFKILTERPITMKRGILIDYRLRLHGIPMRWQSEISTWEPPHRFVDEQRRGPYRRWYHEHLFREENGGTSVQDRINYRVLGGRLVNRFFVEPDLKRIFQYRQQKLGKIFS